MRGEWCAPFNPAVMSAQEVLQKSVTDSVQIWFAGNCSCLFQKGLHLCKNSSEVLEDT